MGKLFVSLFSALISNQPLVGALGYMAKNGSRVKQVWRPLKVRDEVDGPCYAASFVDVL